MHCSLIVKGLVDQHVTSGSSQGSVDDVERRNSCSKEVFQEQTCSLLAEGKEDAGTVVPLVATFLVTGDCPSCSPLLMK
jgi:hypothetical protein